MKPDLNQFSGAGPNCGKELFPRALPSGRVDLTRRVEPSVATLVTWAARDNDRTMLFGAELHLARP